MEISIVFLFDYLPGFPGLFYIKNGVINMSRQIQIRRGTADENDSFTGAIGEVTMDTTNKTLRVHDGITAGGTVLAKQSEIPEPYTMPSNYDFVIEAQEPTSSNSYTWYRKYKSGWVEMGGYKATDGSNPTAVNLPVTMKNVGYHTFIQGVTFSDGYTAATWQVMPVNTTTSPKTTTKFYVQSSISGYNLYFYWSVFGMISGS